LVYKIYRAHIGQKDITMPWLPTQPFRRLLLAVALLGGVAITVATTERTAYAVDPALADEWTCTAGTVLNYVLIVGDTYDCVKTVPSGYQLAWRSTNSRGISTTITRANVASVGITLTLEPDPAAADQTKNTRMRMVGTMTGIPSGLTEDTQTSVNITLLDGTGSTYASHPSINSLLKRPTGTVTSSAASIANTDTVVVTATVTNTPYPTGYSWVYEWKVDNVVVAAETGSTLTLSGTQLGVGSRTIDVYATPTWAVGANTVAGVTTGPSYYVDKKMLGAALVRVCNGTCVTGRAPTTPTTTTAPTTTTIRSTTITTIAATTNSISDEALTAIYTSAIPGVTKTDAKVYTIAPKEVATNSAISVLTPTQKLTMNLVTRTPDVCLPNNDDLVFLGKGQCITDVIHSKTLKVLRTLRTKVVGTKISQLRVGNAIATIAPIYFDFVSSKLNRNAVTRLKKIRSQISQAGSVLVVGHSGTINGNSPANIKLSQDRAARVVTALRQAGSKGPFSFSGVGASAPSSPRSTLAAQAKNRRVIIVLIP
jgi:outer membrane protein OmpA-like peptidoglycan-associated protein